MKETFMSKTVVLVATLDTKGAEARYLKKQMEKHGVRTLVVDGGIPSTTLRTGLGQPQWEAQVSREEVARLGGSTLSQVQALHHEGLAMEVMIRGAAKVVQELHRAGKLDGIISLGSAIGKHIIHDDVEISDLTFACCESTHSVRETIYGILHG